MGRELRKPNGQLNGSRPAGWLRPPAPPAVPAPARIRPAAAAAARPADIPAGLVEVARLAAEISRARGPQYAWAARAPFDYREAMLRPDAATRSGVEYCVQDDGRVLATERVEGFCRAEPARGTSSGAPAIYRVPAVGDPRDGRVLAIRSGPGTRPELGTLDADGQFAAGDDQVLRQAAERGDDPLSRHARWPVSEWSCEVRVDERGLPTGLYLAGATEPVEVDPEDLIDYEARFARG